VRNRFHILKPPDHWPRWGQVVFWCSESLIGLLLLCLLLIQIPFIRVTALKLALSQSSRFVPGEILVEPAWPRLDRIELNNLLWRTENDTLLLVKYGALQIDLLDLWQRDLYLNEVTFTGLIADLPRITEALASRDNEATESSQNGESETRPWLRFGALAPVPSVAIEQLRLNATRIVTAPEKQITQIDLLLAVELRHQAPPSLKISQLNLMGVADSVSISTGELSWSGGNASLTGRFEGTTAPDQRFLFTLDPAEYGRCRLSFQSYGRRDTSKIDLSGLAMFRNWSTPQFELSLSGHVMNQSLHRLYLHGQSEANQRGPYKIDLRLAAAELDLLTQAYYEPSDKGLSVRFAPLHILTALDGQLSSREAGELTGSLQITSNSEIIVLKDAAITGVCGQYSATAELTPEHASATITARWPEAPAFLGRLTALQTQRSDSSQINWSAHWADEQELQCSLTLDAEKSPVHGRFTAATAISQFRIPGPRHLKSLLPASLEIDDLGAIGGTLTAEARFPAQGTPDFSLLLDLTDTQWLSSGTINASGKDGKYRIDTLAVALPGLSVIAAGTLDSANVDLTVQCQLPDATLLKRLPNLSTPEDSLSLYLGLSVTGSSKAPSFTTDLDLAGNLGGTALPQVSGKISGQISADFLSIETCDLETSLGRLSAAGTVSSDSLDVAASLSIAAEVDQFSQYLPAKLLPRTRELQMEANGQLILTGTAGAPRLFADINCALTNPRQDQQLRLTATSELTSEASQAPGLAASFILQFNDSLLATGNATYPAQVKLAPFTITPLPDSGFAVSLTAANLELDRFTPFLPPQVTTEGRLSLDLKATQVADSIYLAGSLSLKELEAKLDNGSWALLGGDLTFGGTTLTPIVEGSISLDAGVINLPPPPPKLLPVSGSALLWDNVAPSEKASAIDPAKVSTEASPGESIAVAFADADSATPARPVLDLKILLTCPGNFWLRGQGMEIELAGDLEVIQRGLLPSIVGDLEAVQGTLRFLGRTFSIERGLIFFYGDLENDPILDLQLAAEFDGTRYEIAVTGPALRPTLTLTSSPEMSEGDIVASLLFGEPLDQLDSGQENLLKQRTAQILVAYSATALQDKLAGSMGIDMISYNQANDADDVSSLMIGKYLSPKVLLRYEQTLERDNAFFVHLDYTLSRSFKVQTSVSHGDASGIELKWIRNY
jgi:TamB, inner membrane protein subunit of TAM complex